MNKLRYLTLAVLFSLTGCGGEASLDNYAEVENGMTSEAVIELLGEPDRKETVGIGGVSGSHFAWDSEEAVISVQFVNGKVISKQFISSE